MVLGGGVGVRGAGVLDSREEELMSLDCRQDDEWMNRWREASKISLQSSEQPAGGVWLCVN